MSETAPEGKMPPASMATLVTTLATQALHAMGALELPGIPKSEPRLDLAKHLIDTVALLEEKTKGNLTADESKLLEETLHQLRIAYLAAQGKKA